MLTLDQFNEWFSDYRAKWPAVGDYMRRQENPRGLRDGWHQTLAAYDDSMLDRVSAAILQGQLEPVENVKLGTFGNEIRQRCRQLLEQDRREAEWERQRQERKQQEREFAPIRHGDMAMMVACGVAADQLLSEKTGEPVEVDCGRYATPHSVQPDTPYDAAIILADDHTAAEAEQAHATLEAAGLTWQQVVKRGDTVRKQGLRIGQEVPTCDTSESTQE